MRAAGARIRLILDGDVSAALLAVSERSPVDLLWGIGGTPEGVISAAALKCMGGQLLGRLWPRDDEERRRRSTPATTSTESSRATTCARATTSSSPPPASPTATCCRACATAARGATTESLVMRSRSGTVRRVHARHDRAKLRAVTGGRYG